jgi:hypothetical protein
MAEPKAAIAKTKKGKLAGAALESRTGLAFGG